MDCKTTQRLFDDLFHDRLPIERAAAIRQHLADCTDCRVLQQRGVRLQRLLALKRYEHPAPEYFENFLADFHGRLLAETQPQQAWWKWPLEAIDGFLSAESMQVWRYGLASALGFTMIVSLMWTGLRRPEDWNEGDRLAAAGAPSLVVDSQNYNSASAPALTTTMSQFPSLVHVASAEYDISDRPAPLRTESTTPQYVLDRISITPASYDVASVHF